MMWYSSSDNGVYIEIKVVPRASKDGVAGVEGGRLKLRIKAPPVDGEANDAVIRFISKRLGVPKRAVTIVRGRSSRTKTLFVEGVSGKEVERLALD